MADEDPNIPPVTGDPPPKPDPKPEKPNDLAAMETALKKANREAADARTKLKEIEDRDKSESDKLTDRISAAEKRASDAELKALRLEVAAAKGLTPTQAKRLVGATQEELEADADELLETFPVAPGQKVTPPPAQKPREDLKPGGGDPDAPVDETNLDILAKQMFGG